MKSADNYIRISLGVVSISEVPRRKIDSDCTLEAWRIVPSLELYALDLTKESVEREVASFRAKTGARDGPQLVEFGSDQWHAAEDGLEFDRFASVETC